MPTCKPTSGAAPDPESGTTRAVVEFCTGPESCNEETIGNEARVVSGGILISRDFMKAGHFPTLLAAFFYFDMSFMVWVLLGALAVQMSAEIGLNAAQKGFMVALPVLAGALLRVVFGVLVDRLRPRRAGSIGQVIGILGLT